MERRRKAAERQQLTFDAVSESAVKGRKGGEGGREREGHETGKEGFFKRKGETREKKRRKLLLLLLCRS